MHVARNAVLKTIKPEFIKFYIVIYGSL